MQPTVTTKCCDWVNGGSSPSEGEHRRKEQDLVQVAGKRLVGSSSWKCRLGARNSFQIVETVD